MNAKALTKQEIKNEIQNKLNEMFTKKVGIATERNYQMGVVNGMVRAFQLSGLINSDEAYEIRNEILDENF